METIAQLETALDALLERVNALESENVRLREELETEKGRAKEVRSRVEVLLAKVQDKLD